MAYQVPFTDQANKGEIVVEDGAPNTETSMTLPGRLSTDYGLAVNTNFLHLLENFANASPPANPVEGQLWYDTTTEVDQLKIYDGTNWVAAGGLKKGSFEPDISNSVKGDLWVNTSTSQLYLYTGSGWLLVGPNYIDGNKSGALVEEIPDTAGNIRTVVINYIENIPVTIYTRVEFSPKTPFAGYSSSVPLKVGVNFNKSLDAKFNGTATLAENLLIGGASVPTTTVMRNNVVNQVTEKLQIKANQGIEIGNAKTLSLLVEGNNGIIENTIPGAPIDLRVNNNGTFTIPIRVKSNTNIGINNLNPTESLDVVGNIKTDSNINVAGTTQSNDPTTGAITTAGGLGVAKNLNIGGNFLVEGNSTVQNILPDQANVRNIGSSVLPFDTLYANRITGNLTGNVTGNVSGTAGSTGKLNSTTTFGMTGHITAGSFTFDGQTGGNVKTFATLASPSIISDQTAASSINKVTDTLLVNQGGVLVSATPNQLIGALEVLPIGTITMFGGTTAPEGWFICDGLPQDRNTYIELANKIGWVPADPETHFYGTVTDPVNEFTIPDLRGVFPTMATDVSSRGLATLGSNAITNDSLELGSRGGEEEVTITQENLPDHTHDLQDGDDNQYYATSTGTYTGTGSVSGNGDTAGTGTRLLNSGGMIDVTNSPLNILNPYLALNFIIYHGVS
jgi:microcystin-dependent protein